MPIPIKYIQQGLAIGTFGLSMGALALWIRPSDKQMGILQMESYQYDESERRLLKAYGINPYDIITLQSLARIYEIMGQPNLEIRYLNEYLVIQPKDTNMRLHLAKVYLWNLQPALAIQQYLAILSYEPNNTDVLRKLANSYVWEQKPLLAIECFLKISQLGELELEDQRALVKLYIGTTQLKLALRLTEKIHRTYEKELIINDYITLADLYSWTNRLPLSDNTLGNMLDQLKDTWEVRIAYVDWYLNIVKPERAVFWLERWSRRPDELQIQSHERLVGVYQAELMEFEAIASMERLVTHPEATEAHRVQLFWMLIDANEAQKAWDWGLTFSSELIERENLLQPLIFLAMEFKELKRAETWARIWVVKSPEEKEPHIQLFKVLQLGEQKEAAKEEIKWLLAHFSKDSDVLQLAVDYFIQEKNIHLALDWANRGKELAKDKTLFLEAIVTCAQELKQWGTVIDTYTELIQAKPESFEYGMGLVYGYMEWIASGNAPERARSDSWYQINRLWKLHQSDDKKAEQIADVSGWAGDHASEFKRWTDLEARQIGDQYQEKQLNSAMNAKEYNWALPILEQRSTLPIFVQLDFERLTSIYQEQKKYQQELDLISGEHGLAMMEVWPRRKRRSELFFSLDRPEEGIDLLVDYFTNIEPNSKNLRSEILEKATWLSNPDKQLEIFRRFGQLDQADGIFTAELLFQKKHYPESKLTILNLKPEFQMTIKAQEVLHWCALALEDQPLQIKALTNIIALETDPKKRMVHQIESASLHHQMGKTDEAGALAEAILKVDPTHQRAMVILGYVNYDRKLYPSAADLLLRSGSTEVHDRFLRGAALLRFDEGYREGERVFHRLLRDYDQEESFKKWNLVLDIGYELNSPFYIERAWEMIIQHYKRNDVMPRYAPLCPVMPYTSFIRIVACKQKRSSII